MTPPLDRIMYVEDEPDIQLIARIVLETVGGFTVRVFSSGDEAVEAASAFNPDLILLDVMMPGMDGPTTLAALRELPGFDAKPVVFITAKVMDSETDHYRDLGAIDVIPKPFDPVTLCDRVRDIWNAHHA